MTATDRGYVIEVDADAAEELIDLEQAGWDSLCDGSASTFYGSLMASDGLMILANGQVLSRADVVAALADAPTWSSYDITNARTVAIDDDTVALVYLGTGRRSGSDDFVGVMTSVYSRRGDGWQLHLYQQTTAGG